MVHYMAFEPGTNRLVLFGGFLAPYDQATGETWIYDVATNRWSQAFPRHSPGPRAWHVMSRTNGPVVLFGGGPNAAGVTNETFLYDSRENTWEQVLEENAAMAMMGTAQSSVATVSITGGRGFSREGLRPHRQ
jgi:N-acetylneuraminic acid mutarotase